MKLAYLDLNVFNNLEKINQLAADDRLPYQLLIQYIKENELLTPYSNAHINDLERGYTKSADYIEGHLTNIKFFTRDVCITHYWNDDHATWHYRDPAEFFYTATEKTDRLPTAYVKLFNIDDDPELEPLVNAQVNLMTISPIPAEFKKLYSTDPFFSVMFPRTKTHLNLLSFCEDLYEFSQKLRTDFALYKTFRKMLVQLKSQLPTLQQNVKKIAALHENLPEHLTWDDLWEKATIAETSKRKFAYDKIIDLFVKTDFQGYRQDDRFPNLMDDALHTYYAAHCDYFITLDKKCYAKAKKVFEKLKIGTEVLTPAEWFEMAYHKHKN